MMLMLQKSLSLSLLSLLFLHSATLPLCTSALFYALYDKRRRKSVIFESALPFKPSKTTLNQAASI
jgi:hypothetical protein